jgi:flagellar motor protein MotB
VLKTLTGQTVRVKGYTDNVPIGPELRQRFPTNVDLSKARAQSVADEMMAGGVPASMISVMGFGDADPVAPNDTPQGRAKNRRVVMDIVESK